MQEPIKFEIHYHGTPVLVGEKYNPKDLHAHLIYSNKEFKDVLSVDYTVDDNLITHTGQNIFKATYIENGKTFIDYFMVYGYTNKRYIDKEFQMFLIHDNGYEENVTDYCSSLLYDNNLGKIYVTLKRLNKTLFKGKFRMILPINSGLHMKYATEWIVLKDDFNIKTTLIKTYNEEVI